MNLFTHYFVSRIPNTGDEIAYQRTNNLRSISSVAPYDRLAVVSQHQRTNSLRFRRLSLAVVLIQDALFV